MKHFFILLLFFSCLAFAKADYAQMSNEELIALIGYVSNDTKESFENELEKRKTTFSAKEKAMYDENIKSTQK